MKDKKEEALTMLCITEVLEILVPIVYITTFLLAFHGPNASILGNVQNEYWNYKKVEDVGQVLSGAYQMFLVDGISILVGGFILLKFAKINIIA